MNRDTKFSGLKKKTEQADHDASHITPKVNENIDTFTL